MIANLLLNNHYFSRCATQVATQAGASTASSTPPRRFSTEGDKLFFSIFLRYLLWSYFVGAYFLPARLLFSDLLYHFAFPLRLALISFPQVLESTRVQLSGYLRALWRRSLPRHWQVHRGEREVHGSEIQWIHTVVTHSAVHTSEQVNRCDSFIRMEVHAQASRWDGFMHRSPFIA